MSRACVFCGDTTEKLTREHVYADWISKFFTEHYKQPLTGKIELVAEDGSTREFLQTPFQHTAKIVCGTCNNGWMSDLEADVMDNVKKMILGKPTFLNQAAQRRLATWCAKTALVIDRLQPEAGVVPDSHYVDMYQQRTALRSQFVLVAFRSLTGKGADALLGGAIKEPVSNFQVPASWPSGDIESIRQEFTEGRKAYKITLIVGNLAALVFGHDLPMALQINSPRPLAKRIWPVSPGFFWESKLSVDKIGGIPAFHAAFAPGANGPRRLPAALLGGYQPLGRTP
jgi:hypothetical protein